MVGNNCGTNESLQMDPCDRSHTHPQSIKDDPSNLDSALTKECLPSYWLGTEQNLHLADEPNRLSIPDDHFTLSKLERQDKDQDNTALVLGAKESNYP